MRVSKAYVQTRRTRGVSQGNCNFDWQKCEWLSGQGERGLENQLQRRADLIPNLVNVTQAYAKQEKELVSLLVRANARNF
ncbi:LemA family protein [Nostoc sp. UHCC 0251]|uniref:LemA family protein n=1 Tax=Nostoc sp. UHCC 0251 TaxID=3110240 RepID=UPI003A4DD217